jgi:hypothetical protein
MAIHNTNNSRGLKQERVAVGLSRGRMLLIYKTKDDNKLYNPARFDSLEQQRP